MDSQALKLKQLQNNQLQLSILFPTEDKAIIQVTKTLSSWLDWAPTKDSNIVTMVKSSPISLKSQMQIKTHIKISDWVQKDIIEFKKQDLKLTSIQELHLYIKEQWEWETK